MSSYSPPRRQSWAFGIVGGPSQGRFEAAITIAALIGSTHAAGHDDAVRRAIGRIGRGRQGAITGHGTALGLRGRARII